uniref:Neur_chan_LBD domain-containing protein n=1 Tax=Syphacia muris TaxID=451379 RepID=A0A0N5AFL4_9BILA
MVMGEGVKELEDKLFQKYYRKHRPVKKDSDQMNIQIYLLIGHIEFVDEHEQTMMLHGLLWATWTDTNLVWEPKDYNNTRQITVSTYKIWLPALSLYNSARGHGWNLHMGGLPAAVKYDGTVWASGSFSFHVTCLFDFTNYPYDTQTCPIVIADWVYDLSKVNLSDPIGMPLFKPSVKLSYDPLNEIGEKTVVNGSSIVLTSFCSASAH